MEKKHSFIDNLFYYKFLLIEKLSKHVLLENLIEQLENEEILHLNVIKKINEGQNGEKFVLSFQNHNLFLKKEKEKGNVYERLKISTTQNDIYDLFYNVSLPFLYRRFCIEADHYHLYDFYSGETLNKIRIDDNTSDVLLKQINDAITYLETKNIVHNDINPGNIMCEMRNNFIYNFVLLDFGESYNKKEKDIRTWNKKWYYWRTSENIVPNEIDDRISLYNIYININQNNGFVNENQNQYITAYFIKEFQETIDNHLNKKLEKNVYLQRIFAFQMDIKQTIAEMTLEYKKEIKEKEDYSNNKCIYRRQNDYVKIDKNKNDFIPMSDSLKTESGSEESKKTDNSQKKPEKTSLLGIITGKKKSKDVQNRKEKEK